MSEHEEHADKLEHELEEMEERSERLEDDIEDTRGDWEAKQRDSSVPGATGEPKDDDG
jgi:predicted  nucleic acid-binding Zn-ribbon protein